MVKRGDNIENIETYKRKERRITIANITIIITASIGIVYLIKDIIISLLIAVIDASIYAFIWASNNVMEFKALIGMIAICVVISISYVISRK